MSNTTLSPLVSAKLRAALVDGISRVGAEIDRCYGNLPGAAERGIYWAYWPPSESTGIDVLMSLYADACRFLREARLAAA
jgi:hypothetical protein